MTTATDIDIEQDQLLRRETIAAAREFLTRLVDHLDSATWVVDEDDPRALDLANKVLAYATRIDWGVVGSMGPLRGTIAMRLSHESEFPDIRP